MANRKLPLIAAAVAGVVLIVGIKLISGAGEGSENDAALPATAPRGCTEVTVAASSEKAGLLGALANSYNRQGHEVGGKCVGVTVVSKASGAAEQALARGWKESVDGPRPDVWSPAASSWVGLLRQDLVSRDRPDITPTPGTPLDSLASTPIVLAMPQPMAEALGWPTTPIGWGDVLALARDPRGWAAKGHQEWGRFSLGKTNPNLSTSGLNATIGAFYAATGRSSDLSAKDLTDPKVRAYAEGVESAVLHYGDTTLTFLSNLQRADDAGTSMGYVSAVAVEEKSVLDYNMGNPTGDPKQKGQHKPPKVPLVAVYPKEGTLLSDNPFILLNADWVKDPVKSGAADFLAWLRAPSQQKVFTDAGFRSYEGKPGAAIAASSAVLANGAAVILTPPSSSVLAGIRAAWAELRKPAQVLLLLDVSGSMGEEVGSAGESKLELANAAALQSLSQFTDRDEMAVWAFTTDLPPEKNVYQELVPLTPLAQSRNQVRNAISDLIPLNGTPLYAATRQAVAKLREVSDPSKITGVVLLTDGQNEYPADDDLDRLVEDLNDDSVESGVRVFSVAYGDSADLETLTKISEASKAAAYDATDPANIERVFTAVVSNF